LSTRLPPAAARAPSVSAPSKQSAPAASSPPSTAPAARPPQRTLSPARAVRAVLVRPVNALATALLPRTPSPPARRALAAFAQPMPAPATRPPMDPTTRASTRPTSRPVDELGNYTLAAFVHVFKELAFGIRGYFKHPVEGVPALMDHHDMAYSEAGVFGQ
ncbi:hypothetical protein CI238_09793, partial [Colletotrichum incanum]